MKYLNCVLIAVCLIVFSCKSDNKEQKTDELEVNNTDLTSESSKKEHLLEIQPISHATLVLTYGNDAIYIDPTGGTDAFKNYPSPDIVLITDVHGDHYNIETLKAIDLSAATVIAPKAVIDLFPENLKIGARVTLNNGDFMTHKGYGVEAIPMYNLREEALKYHTKGRGNGYVITIGGERVYISGDTEDIPEMRALKNIDKAFVCMNLPYTMTVDKAVEAVLEFRPTIVYPYHYRGTDGLSDVDKFKTLVNQGDDTIEVIQMNWYK